MRVTSLEDLVSLCKRRGFIFQGSEIYGGLAGTWDYGPLGVALNNNIKQYWWRKFVLERDDVYGVDAAILMHSKVWEASGHTEGFTDPLVEDKVTHKRYRADHLLEEAGVEANDLSIEQMAARIEELGLKSPEGNELTPPKKFNLLMAAEVGAVEGEKDRVFLRGEITQGVHVNFKNVLDSMHPKLPFGVAQIGKAFRNEFVRGNFLLRVREFVQMELQYYIRPDEQEGQKQYEYWKQASLEWYKGLGIRADNLRLRQHEEHERAHYAKDAWDVEYNTPFGGWKEAWGIHHRGDWDLRRHEEYSGTSMMYVDDDGQKFRPWILETSGGLGRAFLFTLLDAYHEEGAETGEAPRVVLKLKPELAPVKVAVFPLLRNRPELVELAKQVYTGLKKEFGAVMFDDNGNVGKRYRRQDEIGTPYCVTVDFNSLEDKSVTVRDRDTMQQERIKVSALAETLNGRLQSSGH